MNMMKNKYGTCVCSCGAKVKRGETIGYDYRAPFGKRVVSCPSCNGKQQAEPDLAMMVDMAYEDQCRDACGL